MIPAVWRRLRGEDGHVTIWVMIIGVTIMTAGGMVYDGADKANQARRATMIANEAGRAASQELSADVVAGEGAATSYLSRQSMVTDPGVSVQRGPETVTVLATGQAPSLVPFVTLPPIERSIDGPLERVTAP